MAERKDRIRVHIDGKEYSVVGGEFREMLAAVKQVVGRRFIGELKVWELPGQAEDIQHQLSISGYELEGGTPITPAQQEAATAPASAGNDRIRIKAGEYQMSVVGGSFQEMLEVVKKIPGRRFNGQDKIWEIPSDPALVKGVIEGAGFQLEGAEKIPASDVPPMEPPPGPPPEEPPPYESPDFGGDAEAPPYEPPDWWDDDSMPPPVAPPADWQEEADGPPPDAPPPFPPESAAPPPPPPPPADSPAPQPSAGGSGDLIRVRLGETPLVVTGGEFRAMLEVIKKIPGRRFNGQDKVWEIPDDVTLDSVDQTIREAGFTILPG